LVDSIERTITYVSKQHLLLTVKLTATPSTLFYIPQKTYRNDRIYFEYLLRYAYITTGRLTECRHCAHRIQFTCQLRW